MFLSRERGRAKRRYEQLKESWNDANSDDIHQDILARDTTDYLGPDAVNVIADDAVMIDTTTLSVQEVIDHIVKLFYDKTHEG